jgi:eukaryotic-like serine/threonine-protein kinase
VTDDKMVAGRYRLGDKLGRGGMGAVWEAEHVATGRRVALKTLLPGFGRIPEIAKRFEREARATSVLSHPNIVGVIDFGDDEDGGLFLVLERVRGRPLSDLISEGQRLPPARAFHIVRQVLEALAHAHAAGVVHRDLKPENIMLLDADDTDDTPDRVKLLDFGIAKLVGDAEALEAGEERLTQAGVAFGTPTYMSPEQALGEEVDARADLYAVGIILYELLAGRPPFQSEDKVAILRLHVAVDPPPLAETAPDLVVPPAVQGLLDRVLAKRPGERPTDAVTLLAELDAAIAPPSPVVEPRPRPRWVVPFVAGSLVTSAVAVILAAALSTSGSPRASAPSLPVAGLVLPPSPHQIFFDVALASQASRGKTTAQRARARDVAAELGLPVDLLTSYTLDLTQGSSCRDRRDAVLALRKLGDPRAIPALRKARGRSGGFLGLQAVNGCLRAEAEEAIAFLETR